MQMLKEKIERRLGEKLGLKGERCLGPKCAMVRRAYPPGAHGKKKGGRRRAGSEFGTLLKEKQKVRYSYGLDDKEIERYSNKAASKPGIYGANLVQMLETRLDNAVFRLGFVDSRRAARQLVCHGHVTVNGKTINVPSYTVKKGEVIALKEWTLGSGLAGNIELRMKKHEAPQWLVLDKNKKAGTVQRLPEPDDTGFTFDITKIKEFYSR